MNSSKLKVGPPVAAIKRFVWSLAAMVALIGFIIIRALLRGDFVRNLRFTLPTGSIAWGVACLAIALVGTAIYGLRLLRADHWTNVPLDEAQI